MSKYGIVAGKFRLLHIGHYEYFLEASKQVEKVFVLICDDPDVNRLISITETVVACQEIMDKIGCPYEVLVIPYYKDNLSFEKWIKENIVQKETTEEYVIFSSKEKYENILFKSVYLNLNVSLDVSATEIEKNPFSSENIVKICPEYLKKLKKTKKKKKKLDI
ncbi:MAG: adenylyltransferase/cytidyltransferase family protein [Mycoplasmatales bacterium]